MDLISPPATAFLHFKLYIDTKYHLLMYIISNLFLYALHNIDCNEFNRQKNLGIFFHVESSAGLNNFGVVPGR